MNALEPQLHSEELRIVFRHRPRPEDQPAPGEVFVLSERSDRQLARRILQEGVSWLRRGDGAPAILVLGADPNLDDMLAALLLQLQLTGPPISEGLHTFVEYAALAKQGLYPGSVPPEKSLLGVYQALRWKHHGLTDPEQGRTFLAAWKRLADAVLEAARAGRNPFVEYPFAADQFAEEQAFLAADHELYFQDRQAAERRLVRIPDEGRRPPLRPALFLRSPKSCLWKFWARLDPQAPRANGWTDFIRPHRADVRTPIPGYHFLGVDEEGKGNWVFSTNPVLRVPIGSLRMLLQEEEDKIAPERARKDPWVSLYDDTLVAAPHAATALPEQRLLAVVRRWARARRVWPPYLAPTLAAGVAVLVVAVAVGLFVGLRDTSLEPVAAEIDGRRVKDRIVQTDQWNCTEAVELEATRIGAASKVKVRPHLVASRPVRFGMAIRVLEGAMPQSIRATFTINGTLYQEPLHLTPLPGERTLAATATGDLLEVFLNEGDNEIEIALAPEPSSEFKGVVRVNWEFNKGYQSRLHLVAVGIDKYEGAAHLYWPAKDAAELVKAFREQQGSDKLFREVVVPDGFADKETGAILNPDRKKLYAALKSIHAKPGEMVVILVSSHGTFEDHNYRIVLPQDDWLSWSDVYGVLVDIPCPVVVILDTCYSGHAGVKGTPTELFQDSSAAVKKALDERRTGKGIVVVTASRREAAEDDALQHGLLTQAVLECLAGKDQPHRKDKPRFVVTMRDLRNHVEESVKGRQSAEVKATDGLDLSQIPLAVVRPTSP